MLSRAVLSFFTLLQSNQTALRVSPYPGNFFLRDSKTTRKISEPKMPSHMHELETLTDIASKRFSIKCHTKRSIIMPRKLVEISLNNRRDY